MTNEAPDPSRWGIEAITVDTESNIPLGNGATVYNEAHASELLSGAKDLRGSNAVKAIQVADDKKIWLSVDLPQIEDSELWRKPGVVTAILKATISQLNNDSLSARGLSLDFEEVAPSADELEMYKAYRERFLANFASVQSFTSFLAEKGLLAVHGRAISEIEKKEELTRQLPSYD